MPRADPSTIISISFCEGRWIRGSSPRMTRARKSQEAPLLFFILSKTLGVMLLPTNFLIGVGVVGAILLVTRFASLGRKLVIASVLLLVVCGLSPLGTLLLYPLEQRFPPWDAARGAPDGIIVLGGLDRGRSFRRPWHARWCAAAPDRIIAAAALAHRYPNARIVFSGGSANLISNDAQGSRFRRRDLRKSRYRQVAADHGTAFAQHAGECRILQGAGGAEGRRALAAGDVGLPHAAIGRPVPESRICGRALSGRLAGRRPRRSLCPQRTSRSTGWGGPTSRCANGWA